MASLKKGKDLSEIGDLLLFIKRHGVIRFAFIQAKSIKDVYDPYSSKLKRFTANPKQHSLICGENKHIYLMGKKKIKWLNKTPNSYYSKVCYLVFYRKLAKDIFEYDASLSAAQSNINLIDSKSKSILHVENKTISNCALPPKGKKSYYDLKFAKNINRILKDIKDFKIGEILTIDIFSDLYYNIYG